MQVIGSKESEGVIHRDICGEHPPAMIPMTNNLSGKTEMIAIRPQCVRNCSRFCVQCDCCKFKCGHITIIDGGEYEDEDEENEIEGGENFCKN